jgi:sigma-B regulation protein RsbQ
MQNAEHPELAEELEGSFCSTDPKTALHFARTTFFGDNRSDLPKVTVPALVMQGAEDIIAPLEVGQYMHRHLRGSTLHLMKATGHCPHMSHPRETIEVMRQYLRSASGG